MKKIRFILIIIYFGMATNHSFAQDVIQHPVKDSVQIEAREQANELMQSLGLTTKQALLVEDKLTEFLVYKHEIVNSNMSTARKTAKLKELVSHKYSEMRDILTQIQYDTYVKLK